MSPERGVQPSVKQRPQSGSLRTSSMKEKEEELALFLEMRRREKERNNNLLRNSEEFDAPLGSTTGSSPSYNSETPTPRRKNGADDFLNSENDKNDYEWLLTPPGTPPLSSLETDSPKTVRSPDGSPRARPTLLKSRLANSQPGPASRSNLGPKQSQISSPSLNNNNNSSTLPRRPLSSGGPGSRSITPSTRPTLTKSKSTPKPTPTITPKKPTPTTAPKPAGPAPSTASRPRLVRSSTPAPRSNTPLAKSTLPARSSTPTPRSTISSTTKSTLPVRTSTPSVMSTARSSNPMANSKPIVRSSTPIRRPTNTSAPIKSPSTAKSVPQTARSPKVKPQPWKPSEMPGYSLNAPPNLRTTLSGTAVSATRGRAGAAPSIRSSSVDPVSTGRVRRQSSSPARGRNPNLSGSSVPALSRLQSKANDNISPVMYGTKMVERMVNMRKLAPPKQDDKHSLRGNLSGKSSSSPDKPGFGRTLSKKSLDMAIRHMDIRQHAPSNLRPLMTKIPASSVYSVRMGPANSISESPHATSSNVSSEMSVNNNAICLNGSHVDDDDINSGDKAGMHGR